MRKLGLFMVMALLLCGCGAQKEDRVSGQTEASVVQAEAQPSEKSAQPSEKSAQPSEKAGQETATSEEAGQETESTESEEPSAEEEQIKKEVEDAVKSAGSLQEEIKKVDELAEKYEKILTEEDGTQVELNERAQKVFFVWDAELNNLWKRMKSSLSEDTMKDLLEEQRRWVEDKQYLVEDTISDYKEGSIYPMYYSEEMAEVTRNRTYQLASFYAQEKGESFEMPERGEAGKYINDRGTGDGYSSSLIIRHGMEGDTLEAEVSVYKLGLVEGTVKKKGDVLIFTSEDGNLTGKITYGWDGASFEVTKEKKDTSIFGEGFVYKFPTAF